MADAKGPSINPIDDIKQFFYLMVFLWLVWVFMGGPAKYSSQPQSAQYLTSIPEPYGGEVDGSYVFTTRREQLPINSDVSTVDRRGDNINISRKNDVGPNEQAVRVSPSTYSTGGHLAVEKKFIKPVINISAGRNPNSRSADYFSLYYSISNKNYFTVSGIAIRNIFGSSAIIGGASPLPIEGYVNPEASVVVPPDSSVYLISGESPIGVSFRVNKCMVYLGEFQTFTPPLPAQCPECQFDSNHSFTYNSCVFDHKGDRDFYKNDWRIYMGDDSRVWENVGGLIRLIDQSGNPIAGGYF